MAMLAGVMAIGVFFVARAAGPSGARGGAEIELRLERVARPENAAGADPAVRRNAGAGTAEEHQARPRYRIVDSEARKLTRLINNLLDFSKIEAGLRA